jgi:aryl-alcohol dehydrogenase-like predicted oxidoreductase
VAWLLDIVGTSSYQQLMEILAAVHVTLDGEARTPLRCAGLPRRAWTGRV